jgi:TPR repeat protein
MFLLGSMYANGRGTKQDGVKAMYWYRLSADAGEARAMTAIGAAYAGVGGAARAVSKHPRVAARWFARAADAGDVTAMANLGAAYLAGEGVSKNLELGRKWLQTAAECGDALAMVALGDHHSLGESVACDYAQAHRWYSRAAGLGHAGAVVNLGVLHAEGRGVATDAAEAARLFQIAAEAGAAEAMLNLSGLYREGRGVERDMALAYFWARNAVASYNGSLDAAVGRYCREIGKSLTPAMRAEVEDRHRVWICRQEKVSATPHALCSAVAIGFAQSPVTPAGLEQSQDAQAVVDTALPRE